MTVPPFGANITLENANSVYGRIERGQKELTQMVGIANGVAHVSFPGGGIFVPARSPYDRQMLVEHVLDRVRRKGNVQVLVDDQRWLVQVSRDHATPDCWRCGCAVDAVCYCTPNNAAYCVTCAFTVHENAPAIRRSSMARRTPQASERADSAA